MTLFKTQGFSSYLALQTEPDMSKNIKTDPVLSSKFKESNFNRVYKDLNLDNKPFKTAISEISAFFVQDWKNWDDPDEEYSLIFSQSDFKFSYKLDVMSADVNTHIFNRTNSIGQKVGEVSEATTAYQDENENDLIEFNASTINSADKHPALPNGFYTKFGAITYFNLALEEQELENDHVLKSSDIHKVLLLVHEAFHPWMYTNFHVELQYTQENESHVKMPSDQGNGNPRKEIVKCLKSFNTKHSLNYSDNELEMISWQGIIVAPTPTGSNRPVGGQGNWELFAQEMRKITLFEEENKVKKADLDFYLEIRPLFDTTVEELLFNEYDNNGGIVGTEKGNIPD